MTNSELLSKLDLTDPTVIILRGLPGSGKSTITNQIGYRGCRKFSICSADLFWVRNGEYKFNPQKVPQNHYFCLRTFVYDLQEENHTVFLDNTNTTLREFSHYVKIAQAFFYKVVIITLNISPETSIKRNVHQVPEKTIRDMHKRLNNADEQIRINRFCRENKIEQTSIDTEN